MGVTKYQADGKTWWRVDEWVVTPDGKRVRYRHKRIPTREPAMAMAAKVTAEAFEGRFFDRARTPKLTVVEALRAYEPKAKRDNDSWQTDKGRAAHLIEHLGNRPAATLSLKDVEDYRTKRLSECTVRKQPPSTTTLDNEVELLKRVLNYAVELRKLEGNPLAKVKLLRRPNVRRVVLDAETFERLFESSEEALRPILVVAFDTGMREREILNLRWEQVKLKDGEIHLAPQDTKAEDARIVVMTERVKELLQARPHGLPGTAVFPNPATGQPWSDIRKMFRRAKKTAGLPELWFHDLRRSFITRARKLGIPESVVMRMSGHKTRAVFDRYNVVNVEDQRAAAKRLDEARTLLGHSGETQPRNVEGPTG